MSFFDEKIEKYYCVVCNMQCAGRCFISVKIDDSLVVLEICMHPLGICMFRSTQVTGAYCTRTIKTIFSDTRVYINQFTVFYNVYIQ